jgi:hypothetical protein
MFPQDTTHPLSTINTNPKKKNEKQRNKGKGEKGEGHQISLLEVTHQVPSSPMDPQYPQMNNKQSWS